jgi:hypothetical protein
MISQKTLKKFKDLYKKRFNEDLSDAEVSKKAAALLNLYLAVYGSLLENTDTQRSNETAIDK